VCHRRRPNQRPTSQWCQHRPVQTESLQRQHHVKLPIAATIAKKYPRLTSMSDNFCQMINIFCLKHLGRKATENTRLVQISRNVHQVLHQNVGCVLGTAGPSLQHAEAGMHEHHQGTAKAHPCGVQGTSQAIVRRLECCNLLAITLYPISNTINPTPSTVCKFNLSFKNRDFLENIGWVLPQHNRSNCNNMHKMFTF